MMMLRSEQLTLREALASDQLAAFVRQEQDRGVEHSPRARNSNVRSPC